LSDTDPTGSLAIRGFKRFGVAFFVPFRRITDMASDSTEYADPDEPACKYCGGSVDRIIPDGTPYWRCEQHGKLDVPEVLGIEAGEIPEHQSVTQ